MIVIHIPHFYQTSHREFFRPIDRFTMMTHIQNAYQFKEIEYMDYSETSTFGEIVVPTRFNGHALVNLRVNIVPAKVV